MSITQKLQATGLLKQFVKLARTGVNNDVLRAWCKAQPELEGTHLPGSFADMRVKLNCQAPRGGHRPSAKPPVQHYNVARLKEGKRDPKPRTFSAQWP